MKITDSDHIYCKRSIESRCSEDFVDSAVQTDLTMDDIHHMETMTKETDHILREQFVNRITRSDSAVRKYLGIPSITMLFGIFGKLFGNIHLFKMYILIM